ILRKYEGTRLGRQELYAELLDDVPGALWTLDAIDAERRRDHPTLVRVVVAIDPSVSHTKKSDECGIIVAGCGYEKLDHRMHGYVLDDLSAVLSTDAWAQRAVEAYYDWGADRIVAEVNNGGDLVESTIRTVDHRVSYKSVHASRGKYVRAEPVAALYEQKRIHHIGAYPALEDQMCLFTPSMEFLKTSPDRADAVVWAFTEMMLGKQRRVQRMDMNVDEGTRTSPWKGN
ncbi:MAG: DNA-packaging protein, partial [Desulfobacteraceae bacterium]|nr:DNA-packaging protein [Desulfobacteraceae bacterium]